MYNMSNTMRKHNKRSKEKLFAQQKEQGETFPVFGSLDQEKFYFLINFFLNFSQLLKHFHITFFKSDEYNGKSDRVQVMEVIASSNCVNECVMKI